MRILRTAARSRRQPRVVLAAWQCLVVSLLAWPAVPDAATVDGLYEGRVAVVSEDETLREAALGRALRQVLVKLTGVEQPSGRAVDAAVADPGRLMQQYRYGQRDDPAAPLSLWARFDRASVDALVRDAGLPVWSAQRPGVLAWLVLVRDGVAEIVSPEAPVDDAGVARALAAQAWERGVPLAFPLLDLEDRVRVQPETVSQQDLATITEASRRYAPGALLIGRVAPDGEGAWSAAFRFEEGGDADRWQGRGQDPVAAVSGAFDRIARRLAARYAVSAVQAEPGGVRIHVSGVRTLGDYARTLEYLQGLDSIRGLEFSGARGDVFSFRMQVRGGPEALRRLTSFGGVLSPEPAGPEGSGIRFRLLP